MDKLTDAGYQLKLCKACLNYIKKEELICPFCNENPQNASIEFQRLDYGSQIAFRRMNELLHRLTGKS